MIEYLSNGKKYSLSYTDLREHHHRFCSMPDDEFMLNLPEAAHLACIISWFKELGNEQMGDSGVVHQVIHLMTCPQSVDLGEIRELFRTVLALA